MKIHLFTWSTPNGQKASIMLEEIGIPYTVTAVDISKGQQHAPAFRQISPNGKIPAIVDEDEKDATGAPVRIFESGNILIYLAEKSGVLLPQDGVGRTETLGWLFFQVGHLGPMVGQWHWFDQFAPARSELGVKRYQEESLRLLEVLNGRLVRVPYLGGSFYSIADIACYPWTRAAIAEMKEVEPDAISALTGIDEWLDKIGERPAVQKGMGIPDARQKRAAGKEKRYAAPAGGSTVLP